jgi:hypothetical protein
MGHKALVVIRHIVLTLCFWLPAASRKKLERWLRGREEYKQLGTADWVLVSWGKSGRTWLRVMLSRAYQLKGELDEDSFLEFDNFHKLNGELPAVFFTHNNYLKDYTGNSEPLADFRGKRVVLLVRDPLDVAVSQFFQWRFRMRPRKKFINDYPIQDTEIWDFVRDETVGVPRIVKFLNAWARAIPEHGDVLLVRYRDMRADPGRVLTQILEFTGTSCSAEQIAAAVEFARYDNMKKMEETKFFKGTGTRVKPGDKDNPQSFKVRKGKVGGYRDYFTDEQCAELEQMASALDPIFDYRESQT